MFFKRNLLIKKVLFFSLSLALLPFPGKCQFTGDSIKPLPRVNKNFQVVLHIVNSINGIPCISKSSVDIILNQVNAIFAPIGVSLSICETRYIDNSRFISVDNSLEQELTAQYNVPQRINLYYMSAFILDLKPYCGNASLGGISQAKAVAIFIPASCSNAPQVFAHELGHYFSLLHTFEGSGKELADGSNCKTEGDLVCDTPADPYIDGNKLEDYVNTSCRFISNLKDAKGNYYDPDVGNIMSYYGNCRCAEFTRQQYERMANYYLSHKLAW